MHYQIHLKSAQVLVLLTVQMLIQKESSSKLVSGLNGESSAFLKLN